jgi:hypothetical protein
VVLKEVEVVLRPNALIKKFVHNKTESGFVIDHRI